jgi:cytochrome c
MSLAHRAEKWTRFSAKNDALLKKVSIGWIPKVVSTFGSDALGWDRGPAKEFLMRSFVLSAALLLAGLGSAQAQDAAAGEKVFTQCRACHQVGESAKNAVGPVLNGLFGRHSGSVEGYNYSPANKNSGITWDEATFKEYIQNPRAKIPGTKMVYAGLKDEQRINDLVAYLKQFDASGKKATQ